MAPPQTVGLPVCAAPPSVVKPNYLSILSVEHDIVIALSCGEAIKGHADKEFREQKCDWGGSVSSFVKTLVF